jgi:hypothetical protein
MLIPHNFIELSTLDEQFVRDMELTQSRDMELTQSKDTSIFELFYQPANSLETRVVDEIGTKYTCDPSFLQTTGEIVREWSEPEYALSCCDNYQSFCNSNLEEDYHFLNIPQEIRQMVKAYGEQMPSLLRSLASLDSLNGKPWFVQGWSLYNIGSPFMALMTPIFFMILPFLFLKLARVPITVNSYWTYLKQLFRGHSLGQLFEFSKASSSSRIYIIVSVVFYIVNVIQNIIQCTRFIHNQRIVLSHIREMAREVREIRGRLEKFIDVIKSATSNAVYQKYVSSISSITQQLDKYSLELEPLVETIKDRDFSPAGSIGRILSCFYRIHRENDFRTTMNDSYEIVAYQNILSRIHQWSEQMCLVEWRVSDGSQSSMEELLPITVLEGDTSQVNEGDTSQVSNSVDLSKNWIITGKNASGKTTILRSVLWNQLLAQQWGVCFAKNAQCAIYDEFHCYLNIPDSFSRDSLFQAEARRCLEVLDRIQDTPEKNHLCIFDELYSGTNPVEAISGSVAYIHSLEKAGNTRFLLTTHFHNILRYIRSDKTEKAYMLTEKDKFTYKLQKGVNRDFGAIEIFENLGYSTEFIHKAKTVLKKVNSRFR